MRQTFFLSPADILVAHQRIAGIIQPTPLEISRPLCALTGAEVWLKLELAQVTGSFKIRGAANALRQLPATTHVVACSAGNHALSVAHTAAMIGTTATLVVPATASPAKIAALRRYPVDVILHGTGYDAAEAEALRMAAEYGWHFISPYNDPLVIAGQGTLAVELWQTLADIDVVVVAVGGGGLASGVGFWAKAMNPRVCVIGVQAAASAAMTAALRAGRVVPVVDEPTLADGLAGNLAADTITLPILQQVLDDMVTWYWSMNLLSLAQCAGLSKNIISSQRVVLRCHSLRCSNNRSAIWWDSALLCCSVGVMLLRRHCNKSSLFRQKTERNSIDSSSLLCYAARARGA